jgi:integrase
MFPDSPLLPELSERLRKHRREAFGCGFARQADYVFTTSEGTPFGYRNLAQRGLTKAAERAGLDAHVPRLNLHDPRHTFGSHLVRQDADVVTVLCRATG